MYIVLLFLAFFGILPLGIILYKRSVVKRIVSTGKQAKARVYEIRTTQKHPQDIVCYFFQAEGSMQQYTGVITTAVGVYRKGQTLDVFYLPGNPKKHAVKNAWKSNFLVGFGVAVALFMLYAVYKLYQMIQSGEI